MRAAATGLVDPRLSGDAAREKPSQDVNRNGRNVFKWLRELV